MKKFLIILLALTALVSCGKNETSTSNDDISGIQQETLQPDPYSPEKTTETTSQTKSGTLTVTTQKINEKNTTTAETTEITETTTSQEIPETTTGTTETTTASEIIPEDVQPDPLGAGAFEYDEDGAVQFMEDTPTDDEQTLISAGQALFESACQTEWNFTVGCPYAIDTGYVIRDNFNWIYYKITDENIHTFADIENNYYSVFSDRYPNEDLKTLYIERDGNVYALNGQREMNAYYSMSRITGIESRTEDEIFFTVENQFEGNDQNPDTPYSENETFSVVISPDGKWKAGKFRLPY